MKTKECPFCHEEISEDAILCKYCHNLLTEDDDDDVPPPYTPEPDDEERTRVFSASEAVKNFRSFNDDEDYDDEYGDDEYEDYDDDEYDDDDDYDDDSAKRTFITAAVITLGILLIVIIAIVAGYKIFGKDDDSSAPGLSASMVDSTSKNDQSAKPADTSLGDSSTGDETSTGDDTSSIADTSSEDETSSTPADSSSVADSSSQAEPSSAESSEDESSNTASMPENTEEIIAKAGEIISPHNDSGISGYEYRAEDSAGITMEYYYIHMNNGISYSVAYNPTTGKYIIAGGGDRFEG